MVGSDTRAIHTLVRTSKATRQFPPAIFRKHRPVFSRAIVGRLPARHDLIDRIAIEPAINVDSWTSDEILYRVLDLVEAENWVRSWQG